MRPHQADVAFVLESVAGVRALFAISSGPALSSYDFAVELVPGGRVLAEMHYALLRVMTHDDCARVLVFHFAAPRVVADGAELLALTTAEREAARARVPAAQQRPPFVSSSGPAPPFAPPPSGPFALLIVDDDEEVHEAAREALDADARAVIADIDGAARAVQAQRFDLILCDAKRAFGLGGLLARLPLDVAGRVLVLARPLDVANARSQIQGKRILTKPVAAWLLRERITRASFDFMWAPDVDKGVVPTVGPRRRLIEPDATAAFSVLLADLDDEVHEAIRRVFRGDARQVMKRDPEEAAESALTAPFHLLLCSAKAALHPRSFLDAIAREDPDGADRVVVVAPARDVPYVKHKLDHMNRKNAVLALPIDDAALRREVFRDRPALATRLAASDLADIAAPELERARFRRLAVLVVDDDRTTQILFAAGERHAEADIALATSTMEAFEHVMTRPVDLLLVSATMRGDGAEPFYRVLWRLKPELKSRCVLVMARDLVPASAPRSSPPRIIERPLTRDAVGRIVELFARR